MKKTFLEVGLTAPVYRAVEKAGYTEPTPIQAQTIPLLLQSKDLIGIAQTGMGKTAAFVLPLLQKLDLQEQPERNKPRALILAPTRELAAQIGESCKKYGLYTKTKTTVIFGGVSQRNQVRALEKGVDILVATPGRLLDLIEQKKVFLTNARTFILDEADRMLDMGFVRDIRKLEHLLPNQRQTIMFSATMSKEVKKLANDFLRNPEHIEPPREDYTKKITQELYYVQKKQKNELLLHLIKKQLDHVLIFTRTKAGANKTAKLLTKHGFPAEAMHGDKSQNQRVRILKKFQQGRIILVATDVAARGLDVNNISHVINYDLPNEPENYVHRIGRTARAGKQGTAYSFCDELENEYLRAIQKVTGNKLVHVKHPFHSEEALKSKQPPPKRGGGRKSSPKKYGKKPRKFSKKNFKGSGYKKGTTRKRKRG